MPMTLQYSPIMMMTLVMQNVHHLVHKPLFSHHILSQYDNTDWSSFTAEFSITNSYIHCHIHRLSLKLLVVQINRANLIVLHLKEKDWVRLLIERAIDLLLMRVGIINKFDHTSTLEYLEIY